MTAPDITRLRAPSDVPTYLLVKRGLYYRPGNQGYTGIRDKAGRYYESDAMPDSGVEAIHQDEAPIFSPACFEDVKVSYLMSNLATALAEKAVIAERLARYEAAMVSEEAREVVARALCELHIRTVRRWDTQLEHLERVLHAAVDYAWRDHEGEATAALAALARVVGE